MPTELMMSLGCSKNIWSQHVTEIALSTFVNYLYNQLVARVRFGYKHLGDFVILESLFLCHFSSFHQYLGMPETTECYSEQPQPASGPLRLSESNINEFYR